MADFDSTRAEQIAATLTTQPLQVVVGGRLGLTQQELYDVITDFDRLADWLPMVKRSHTDNSKAETPGGVGAVRVIYAAGAPRPTLETVRALEAPSYLAYSANDEALMGMATDHLSVLTCDPHPEGGSVLVWLAYAKPSKNPLLAFIGRKVFGIVLGGGLKKLQKKYPV
jgi:hypothetical protein